jgi:hypothetical protein
LSEVSKFDVIEQIELVAKSHRIELRGYRAYAEASADKPASQSAENQGSPYRATEIVDVVFYKAVAPMGQCL